jgi:hypothetical protein
MRQVCEKTVHDILSKEAWNDEGVRKSAHSIRRYKQMLGFSENWMSEYVFNIVTLAKKEQKPSDEDIKKAENKLKK